MRRKNTIRSAALVGFCVVLAGFIIYSLGFHDKPGGRDHQTVAFSDTIEVSYRSPTNNIQNGSTVWFGEWEGQFLFASDQSKRFGRGKLMTLHAGTIEEKGELFQTGSAEYLGSSGPSLYYWNYQKGKTVLFCFDLESGERTALYSTQIAGGRKAVFREDGSAMIPLTFDPAEGCVMCLHVRGNEVLEKVPFEESYYLGERRYDVIASSAPCETITCTKESDPPEELVLALGDRRHLIPTDSGMIIHNMGRQTLLYYIDRTGCCSELFSVPCSLSDSAVAIYHDQAFISVFRYAKGSSIGKGFVGFEEDKLSGTYRIDLTDFSTEKISDTVFTGMYIFNDSEIYACDKYYRMYRLAFDGSVIESMDWPRST